MYLRRYSPPCASHRTLPCDQHKHKRVTRGPIVTRTIDSFSPNTVSITRQCTQIEFYETFK